MNNNISKKQIHIKIPPELHKSLKICAAVRETTIQEYVVKAIQSQIEKDQIHETDDR